MFQNVLVLSIVASVLAVFPFQNPSLPWDQRVDDLVMRMTIEEIANQTLEIPHYPNSSAIPRLGVKPYVYGTECERGVLHSNSTAFPHSIGLAASWSHEVLFNMSDAVSKELRGRWNTYRKRNNYYQTEFGLSCYSPVINIARHPLWGRTMETYGECPYLSGVFAQEYVWGLQGSHPRYSRATAGCKHFDVHGGPENIPSSRFSFDSKVSMRDWRMTFLPAFEKCVKAGTYSLMCSYNSINGIPACANKELLTDITRGEWGFKGYIVSDAGAIDFMKSSHHYTKDDIATVTASIKAGCNMELELQKGNAIFLRQIDALNKGLLTESELRENVKPLLYTRMKIGDFDPDAMNPYSSLDMSTIQSPEHRSLALLAAQKTFTLLKNDKSALPLSGKVKTLAVVGPFANVTDQLFGDYTPDVDPQFTTTVWQGLKNLATVGARLASGCGDTLCQKYDPVSIQKAVSGSDLIVVALGTGQAVEQEGRDRASLDLPGYQLDLLQDAVYYAKGAKVIVLLFNAGPLDVTWAKFNPAVSAIMECYFPAQSTGAALYNTFTAADSMAVPAGRLPMTWPAYLYQVPEITNYTMIGRTYRYFSGEPLYAFGYGLSYTEFEYSDLSVMPNTVPKGQNMTVKVTVENVGQYDADEVIQVYITWPANSTIPLPKLQLVGFKRQLINRKKKVTVEFEITAQQMSVWLDDKTGWGILEGSMTVYAGGQQPDQRTKATSNVQSANFMVK